MYEHVPFPHFLNNEFQMNFQMAFLLIAIEIILIQTELLTNHAE